MLEAEAIWHEVTFREPDFRLRETYRTRSLPNDFLQAAIFLEPDHDSLCVRLFSNVRLRLNRGQYGRILYNFSGNSELDGWRQTIFRKVNIRVAFDLAPQTHLFHREPDQEYISLRDLT